MNRNTSLEQRIRALEESEKYDGDVFEDTDGTRYRIPDGARYFIIQSGPGHQTDFELRFQTPDEIDAELQRIRTLKRIR